MATGTRLAAKPQSPEQWAAAEKLRLDRFVTWYRAQRAKSPAQEWPLRQPPGEWDEQYMMFDDPDAPADA